MPHRNRPGKYGSAFPDAGPPSAFNSKMATYEEAKELACALLNAKAYNGEEMTLEHYLWQQFLTSHDERIKLEAFKFLNLYKYGKPVEKKDVTLRQEYVAEAPAKMPADEWRKRFAQDEKDGNA